MTTPENTITYHNALCCHPKFCISIVFSFSWGHFNSREKLKTMLMQNFVVTNKEHYGMLWYFWSGQLHVASLWNKGWGWPWKQTGYYYYRISLYHMMNVHISLCTDQNTILYNEKRRFSREKTNVQMHIQMHEYTNASMA